MHLGLLGQEETLCCTAIPVGRIRREGFSGNMLIKKLLIAAL